MKNHEIEAWALRVVESVRRKQPHEDSRVELKANWITPEKAARRIAGQANALRGETFLWLIGVDEIDAVNGVAHEDLSTWQTHADQGASQFRSAFIHLST